MNSLLISVCIPAYNHVSYIRQCLEGVLMQKTNFQFEILLGEDGSSDGTKEVCIDYKKKYPDKIKLFLNNRKNIIIIDGRPTGRWNFINLLKNAEGKYIALLDGDDYWTDPFKLQKQVDFLEQNKDFALCFHAVKIIDETNTSNIETPLYLNRPEITTIEDLCQGNYIYTASSVFKNGLIKEFPTWYYKCSIGDWPLYLMIAEHGKIKFINEEMAVYRKHGGGIWSQRGTVEVFDKYLKTVYLCSKHFDKKYKKYFFQNKIYSYVSTIKIVRPTNIFKAAYYTYKLLLIYKYNKLIITRKQILKNLIFGYKGND
jgi:glycosyltransferase involved in cell wall biosynthesis